MVQKHLQLGFVNLAAGLGQAEPLAGAFLAFGKTAGKFCDGHGEHRHDAGDCAFG